jgi:hypothetical protein
MAENQSIPFLRQENEMEQRQSSRLTFATSKAWRFVLVVFVFAGFFCRFAFTGTNSRSSKLAPIEVDLSGIASEDLDFWRSSKFFGAVIKEDELLAQLGYENDLKKAQESAEEYDYLLMVVKFEGTKPPKYPKFRLVIHEGYFETIDVSVPRRLGHSLPIILRVEELGSLFSGPRLLKKKTVFHGFPKMMISSVPN